jgi:cytidylate kinase
MSSDGSGPPRDAARLHGPNGLRVAISGKSGCGNSTVSRLVAARLGLRVVNYTFKNLARDRGKTFEEICILAETDPQYDHAVDRMQVKLAEEGGCVLGSRLAIWLLRETALTVYLRASLDVRAGRIARREGKPLTKALRETEARDRRDHDRYARLYGYEVDSYEFAALIVDAETRNQDEVAREIVEHAARLRS